MTTYTTIADSAVDPNAPVTSELMTALRDNPIAISEGDATAPKISTAAFESTYYTQGGIGTYCFASGPTTAFGSTVAGSSLNPATAMRGLNFLNGGSGIFSTASALSGTWRAMGEQTASEDWVSGPNVGLAYGATLWLRIS